ncbi:uncharacterized protein LOC131622001 [Vicia villosa]|uniref:uncharacterized protein LOC131622001 n=1 Tax=Vicia villosa TaxID=3911 RepID=UPI00273B3922|nr:uncharacterized protein LOC131622001 [Vicia villosa]
MERWKNIPLSKEEEEGIVAAEEEANGEEIFRRSLAGRLWTDGSFNSRAFRNTMVAAWRLKNPVEIQELNKNLLLFNFSTKRDMEFVLKSGPWSFDRALLVLAKISGDEQPTDLDLHTGDFWVRIYELPLALRTEAMAKKLGNILGEFVEADPKEAYRNGRFLRVKVMIDLKKPLKRGTMVKYKEKSLRVHFKYERLLTFCYICGRIGHQMKDCEDLEDMTEEGFEDLDEQELSYGHWLRASPLPKLGEEFRTKDSSSGTCNRSLFNVSSSQSRCGTKDKEKLDELEVEQLQKMVKEGGDGSKNCEDNGGKQKAVADVEDVAESLSAVALSQVDKTNQSKAISSSSKQKKWTRKRGVRKVEEAQKLAKEVEEVNGNWSRFKLLKGLWRSSKVEKRNANNPKELNLFNNLYQRWCWITNTA